MEVSLFLVWAPNADVVHDIGRMNVNSIQELHLLGGQAQPGIFFSQEGSLISARQPSLNDLDTQLSTGGTSGTTCEVCLLLLQYSDKIMCLRER